MGLFSCPNLERLVIFMTPKLIVSDVLYSDEFTIDDLIEDYATIIAKYFIELNTKKEVTSDGWKVQFKRYMDN